GDRKRTARGIARGDPNGWIRTVACINGGCDVCGHGRGAGAAGKGPGGGAGAAVGGQPARARGTPNEVAGASAKRKGAGGTSQRRAGDCDYGASRVCGDPNGGIRGVAGINGVCQVRSRSGRVGTDDKSSGGRASASVRA